MSGGKYFKRGGPRRPMLERFWEKVDRSGGPDSCWLWLARCQSQGYGVIGEDAPSRKWVLSHRFSWELVNGPIPAGLNACHRCDNTRCVNPSHLFLGTQDDNMKDAASKGRMSRAPRVWGDKHPHSILNADKVRAILAAHAAGETNVSIARRFGVGTSCIWSVVHRQVWRHVDVA